MAGSLGDIGETFVRARLDTSQLEAGFANALGRTKAVTAQIESAWTRQGRLIEAGFGRITQASLGAQRGLDVVRGGFDRAGASAARFGGALLNLRTLVAGTIAAAGVRGLVNYAAAWENAGLKIRSVSLDATQAAEIQTKLFQVAQETGVSFEALASTYQRFTFATGELNLGVEGSISILTTLSQIAAVSGATAVEQANAMRQLTQAFAAGGLRGDEFRSVSEQLPGVLRAVADATGKTTDEVIAFGRQHGIATDVVVDALQRYEQTAKDAFEAVQNSITRAQTRVSNAFLKLIGDTTDASGAAEGLSESLEALARLLESPAFVQAATVTFGGITAALEEIREAVERIVAGAEVLGLLFQGEFEKAGAAALKFVENLGRSQLELFGLVEEMKSVEDQALKMQNMARLSETKGAGLMPALPPIELRGAPSGRGGGAKTLTEAEKAAKRVAEAIEEARFEIAEFQATTDEAKLALEVLQAAGLPFDRAELEKLVGGNAAFREQINLLIRLTAARLEAKKVKGFEDDMTEATEEAQVAMAKLTATTFEEKAALEAIEAAGLPFDDAEREKILSANAALRENFNELTRVTEARLRLAETQAAMEKAAEVIPERRRDVFEQQRELLAPGLGPSLDEIQGRARTEAGKQLGLPVIEAEREAILASNDALRQKFELLTQINAQSSQIELQSELWQQQAQVLTEISSIFSDLATTAIFEGPQQAAEQFLKTLVEMAIQAAFIMAIFGGAGALGFGPGLLGAGGGLSQLPIFGALFAGGRQHGGSVRAGQDYLVGEAGPELFKPATSGTIVSNKDLSSSIGNTTFSTQIDARGAQAGVGGEINRALIEFERRLPKLLAESDRRGLSGRKI